VDQKVDQGCLIYTPAGLDSATNIYLYSNASELAYAVNKSLSPPTIESISDKNI